MSMFLKIFYFICSFVLIVLLCAKTIQDDREIDRLESSVRELRRISYETYDKYAESKEKYRNLFVKYEELNLSRAKAQSKIEELEASCK